MTDFWAYPLQYGDRLSSHDWMPLHLNRLMASRFMAYTLAENRRAEAFTAMLLWFESLKQDPAGTLPDDDVQLAQIARCASLAEWQAMRTWALYGWAPCHIDNAEPGQEESRLGHRVVAEVCADMFRRKKGREQARGAQQLAVSRSRVKTKLVSLGMKRLAEAGPALDAITRFLVENSLYITDDNVRQAAEVVAQVPRVVSMRGDGGASP